MTAAIQNSRHSLHRRTGHWGLLGIRERADRIGGKLQVVSDDGAGTKVDLFIPAHIAYRGKVGGRVAAS